MNSNSISPPATPLSPCASSCPTCLPLPVDWSKEFWRSAVRSWQSGPATCTDLSGLFKTDLAKGPPPSPGPGRNRPRGSGSITREGYVRLHSGRRFALLHRLVMERVVGRRLLPGESVHHRDGNKLNNTPENLQLLANSVHTSLHRSATPLVAYCRQCGRPFRAVTQSTGKPQRCCSCRCHARWRHHWPKTPSEFPLWPPAPPAASGRRLVSLPCEARCWD